ITSNRELGGWALHAVRPATAAIRAIPQDFIPRYAIRSRQVLRGDGGLLAAGQQGGLGDYSLGIVVETIAVAVWTRRHAAGDNRIAAFADFILVRFCENLFRPAGAVTQRGGGRRILFLFSHT